MKFKKEDYIVNCTWFECSMHKIETDEQLSQAEIDDSISLFNGSKQQIKEILDLQELLHTLEQSGSSEDYQRIDVLKSNIRMMCNREI